MALPIFHSVPPLTADTLKRNEAAVRLGISRGSLDKLVTAGVLNLPIKRAVIDELAARPNLRVREGELTVLRTAARAPAYPGEDRATIGFHATYDDGELEATSLRWWRCDPDKVLKNELFAVTISTVPVALYRITSVHAPYYRGDEDTPRYRFSGHLLARWGSGEMRGTHYDGLRSSVRQVMDSRISVSSGGPIAYLSA